MVCHFCQAAGNLSETAYGKKATEEGPTSMELLNVHVACGTCGELLAAGYLSSHMMNQHGRVVYIRQQWSTLDAETGPQTFRMTFPDKGGPRNFPVVGCPVRVATRSEMRVNSLHRHVLDTVVILEEVNFSHPRCA